MRTVIIIIFTFFCHFHSFSQTKDLIRDCNKDSTNNYIDIGYEFDPNVQNSSFGINPKCVVYDNNETDELHKKLDSIAKKYIIERTGIDFYKKVSNDLNYKMKDSSTCRSSIKYIRNYSFLIGDSLEYFFFIKFKANGEIIPEQQIPKKENNSNLSAIIDYCTALKIAQVDEYFRYDFKGISLQYSEKINSFVWCIITEDIHHMKPSYEYSIFVNAVTGKLVTHSKQKFIVAL